jgi:hypothetical protein
MMRVVTFGFQTWGHRTLSAVLDAGHEVALAVTHPVSNNPVSQALRKCHLATPAITCVAEWAWPQRIRAEGERGARGTAADPHAVQRSPAKLG